jgi:plastocyanin
VLSALAPASAIAGGPGKWTRLTPPTQSNSDQPGYARTDDDVLQVLWNAPNAANSAHEDLFRSSITLNGTLIGSNPVETDWVGVSSPALVVEAGGVHVDAFFGGQRTTNSNETNKNLNQSFSEDRGEQWQLIPGSRAENGAPYASPMSATRLGDVFWQAWGGTGYGAFSHRGTSPSVPSLNLQDRVGGGCCGYDANITADAVNNTVTAVWYSNSSDSPGVWSQPLDPATGNPVGSPGRMPGSVTSFQGQLASTSLDDRVPLATLSSGGSYVAYPSGYPSAHKVLVWKVGPAAARKVGINIDSLAGTTISATSDNRLWVAWSANVAGVRRVVARRSNQGATAWGRPVAVKPPKGTSTFYELFGEANPSGVLDVMALVTTPAGVATWHSQVQPGLTLAADPAKIQRSVKTEVTFTVTDAGHPVAGAKVNVGGKSGKTGAGGTVKLKLGPFGKKAKSLTAKATREGYALAKVAVKIKK